MEETLNIFFNKHNVINKYLLDNYILQKDAFLTFYVPGLGAPVNLTGLGPWHFNTQITP
jgi:hypothetical protein